MRSAVVVAVVRQFQVPNKLPQQVHLIGRVAWQLLG